VHQPVGDRGERGGGDHARGDQALVERALDVAGARAHEEGADDRGDDRDAAEQQREQRHAGALAEGQHAEQHHGDRRDGVGLEQVGGHAGAVADVVAHVVGDHGRVARVVLGDPRLDLADQVGADVGRLGEDAAAEPREDRDQRAAEAQADQRVDRRLRAVVEDRGQRAVIARHAGQRQAHDEQAGDGAAAKRRAERRRDAAASGFGDSRVGPHRNVHADVAGRAGEDAADREADRHGDVLHEDQRDEQHDADAGDRRVLAVQVGARARLDRRRDALHPLVAGRERQQRPRREGSVQHRAGGTHEGDDDPVVAQKITQGSSSP
jgi:hypothetical protein